MSIYRLILIVLIFLIKIEIHSQVITSIPAFPDKNDTITIFYHSDRGNNVLSNADTIYAIVGLITSNSTSGVNKQHLAGNGRTPDPRVLMTYVSKNVYKLDIPILNFFGIKEDEKIFKLAFLFRNADGSLIGGDTDGGDIYIDLFHDEPIVKIIGPSEPLIINATDIFSVVAQSLIKADLTLFINNVIVAEVSAAKFIEFEVNVKDYEKGTYNIIIQADYSNGLQFDSSFFTILTNPNIIPVPDGIKEGINVNPNQSDRATFKLYAPGKKHIYLLGDFNNWRASSEYLFNIDSLGNYHWIDISGLDPEIEYGYQYFILDDNIRKADPFNQNTINPWIPEEINDGLKPYPVGKTKGIISVFQTNQVTSSPNQTQPFHYRVSGSIENIDNVDIYIYREHRNKKEYLNKTRLVNGAFVLEGSIANPEIIYVGIGDQQFKSIMLFLSGDDITISANYNSLKAAKISGAPYQAEIDIYFETFSSIFKELNKEVKDGNLDYGTAFNRSAIGALFKFAEEYPHSPALPYYIKGSLDFFELEDLLELYAQVDKSSNKLKTKDIYNNIPLNDSPTLQILRKRISELDKVAVGKKYTDFTMPDTLGNLISISDYDGQYRLVDFWASWCSPCRKEFPELIKIYHKYKDNNFEVIGISFDSDLDKWKRAIVKDHIEWIQMSAPKSWDSDAGKLYVFGGIPANVLIGPNGTILARNIHGEELQKKLEEIFGF
jgi:thiol-disulfide isomerase/thioredoxin